MTPKNLKENLKMNETILLLPLTIFLLGIIVSFLIFIYSEKQENSKVYKQ